MKILSILFAVILLIGSAGMVMAGPKGPPPDAAGAPGIGRGMGSGQAAVWDQALGVAWDLVVQAALRWPT